MAIQVQPRWLITIPEGVLKISQIILAIIVLICMSAASLTISGAGFVQFVATVSLIYAIVFTILYVLSVPENIEVFPWNLAQMAAGAFWVLCYLIRCGF